MKRLKVIFLFLIFCVPVLAAGESKDNAKQLRKAADVVNQVMATPEKSIPRDLLARAVCVGIIPSELKFAFGFGGNYGRGVLVCRRGGNGPWGAPSFFTVMNPDGARKLVQDSVKLGAEVSAAAGPVGRSAEGATDAQMHAEILSYSRSQGLFAGVSLSGAVVKQDEDDNQKLYGRRVTAKQILIDGTVRAPAGALALDRTLAKYSPRGGQSFNVRSASNRAPKRDIR